jgi:hypothetical protein
MPSGCASPRSQRPAGADRPAWLPHPPTLTIPAEVTPAWVAWSGPRPCPAGPPPGSTVGRARCGSGLVVPACLAGWSEPGNKPRAVTPGGRPDDAPARGDQHPARIGDRQGPQMHLLAEAQRSPSVHPADLRLALPGVPRPRPAVLQPRRPAVPGARHRAAGSGAGPAVVGQGDGQAPQCAGRSVAMALTAGRPAAGSSSAGATR